MKRMQEAQLVAAHLSMGKNVKIVGLRHSGKTTLLKALKSQLKSTEPYLDNVSGEIDPWRIDSVNGSRVMLIDEAITMFVRSHEAGLKAVYLHELQRILGNGTRAVFALHKKNEGFEQEFDRAFPGCERLVLNAQLPREAVEALLKSRGFRQNGTTFTLDGSAIKKIMLISGQTVHFIDSVLDSLGDMLEDWSGSDQKVNLSSGDIDARSLVLSVARKPCGWVDKLDGEELALLKDVLMRRNGTTNSRAAAELVGLGILATRNGTLFVPGSAVHESLKRSIEMLDGAH